MFTVECPGCKASYQIDERRVPASGLRMRCPKCSTAFMVEKPASDGNSRTAAPGEARNENPVKTAAPAPATTSQVLPQPSEIKSKLAPPRPPPRPTAAKPLPPTERALPVAPAANPSGRADVDERQGRLGGVDDDWLPVVAAPSSRQESTSAQGTFAPEGQVAKRRAPVDSAIDLDLDGGELPAARRSPTVKTPAAARAQAKGPSEAELSEDIDLPAPAAFRPSPNAKQPSAASPANRYSYDPDLPATPGTAGYDSDSELPAAFGSRPLGSKPGALSKSNVGGESTKDVNRREVPAPNRTFGEIDLDLPVATSSTNAGARDFHGGSGRAVVTASSERPSPHEFAATELELPSPIAHQHQNVGYAQGHFKPSYPDDFELELPSPAQLRKEAAAELPSPRGPKGRQAAISGHEIDLPDFDAALPAATNVGLPASAATNVGLPASVATNVGLPASVATNVGLPASVASFGASSRTLAGIGSSSALGDSVPPMAASMSIPPASVPELDLGWGASASIPAPSPFTEESTSGVISPPTSGGAFLNSLPAPREEQRQMSPPMDLLSHAMPNSEKAVRMPSLDSSQSSASVSQYGEVSLESSDEIPAVDTDVVNSRASLNSTDGLEFGGLPQTPDMDGHSALAAEPAATAAVALPQARAARPARESAKLGVGKIVGYSAIAVATLGGLSLNMLPDVGPFAAYWVIDQVNHRKLDVLLREHVEKGTAALARDDFTGLSEHISVLEAARRKHERLRSLSAYGAYFAFAVELRHGTQSVAHARAVVALNELGARTGFAFLELAQAARAATEGNLARARRTIDQALAREPRNVEDLILSAEIGLLEHRFVESLQQWQAAEKLAPTARTAFGQARALLALGKTSEAAQEARRAIERNPQHVGAKLQLARIALEFEHNSAVAEHLIESVLNATANASTNDVVQAKTLSGDSHLLHSRISLAEAAFQEAIAKDPKSPAALRGLGEALFRAGRYAESLARFEAALQADPDSTDAAIGVGKTQLALERIREATDLLSRLRQSTPKSFPVNYWYARACEAGGNRGEAEKAYGIAIEVGGTDPAVVDAYVGLALVKSQQGRTEEAQKVLEQAQQKLPKLPKIHEAVGQLALAEGRYLAAVEQFQAALALDPGNIAYKFRLGVAQRKNRQFDAAGKSFEEVAAVDRDFPGLALERGQLFESSGQTEEALRAFESALAKAPNDPDLMLRVGCGKVSAGRPEQAEQLLKKVLEQRPMSAETHHCLGRAQLLEGSNLALALRTLERAVELDPHRPEYHLYVGWAANEAGNVALAEQSLKKALELDQGLGDAYWQRGILRYRQGAIKDAVTDLTKALALRPGRYEAHAALADAYFDLGLEAKALEQWAQATEAQPDNATWAFRYGKLLQTTHHDAQAKAALEKAIELVEKSSLKPRWIWEAHHLLARALGSQPAAVKHWQSFLELSPRDNVYRDEAKQTLVRLGQPWDKD